MQWSDDGITQVYEMIGERVRAARVRGRLTQTELAERVGLTRSSVANIEAGRQRAMVHTLLHLADALEVALTEVLPESLQHPKVAVPPDSLQGQPRTTQDFVNAVVRRAGEE